MKEFFVRFGIGGNWAVETFLAADSEGEAEKKAREELKAQRPDLYAVVEWCNVEIFA